MTVATNTIQATSRIGVREDLEDMIYNISPTETPVVTAVSRGGRGKASNTYVEWQTDTLVSATADNYTIQGDDVANDSRAATTRVGTYTQIMKKVVGTSSTARAVKTAGRSDEHDYQVAKAMQELKRDMETRFSANKASVAPTASVAGQTAGALAWLSSNVSRGATGSSGGFSAGVVSAATNGTQRALTESLFKTVLGSIWTNGGEATIAVASLTQKQNMAAFVGLADQRRDTGDKRITIVAGADVYVSDVGKIEFVASRFCSSRDVLILDPEMFSIAELHGIRREPLAKTGLANREVIYTELALKCHNEAGSGVVADLT